MRKGSFISLKDYCQIRFFWNKSSSETQTQISYWIRPESTDHKNVYVSTSGNDSNPGTKDSPYKTIAKAMEMKPQNIYLHKGDTFYENIILNGINLLSYGEGPKPLLSGLKILPDSAIEQGSLNPQGKWIPFENGSIWRIKLAMNSNEYEGFKVSSSILNNIGTIVDLNSFSPLNCLKVQNANAFMTSSRNWVIWQPTSIPTSSTPASYFDYLYVRYNGNLRKYRLGVTIGATCLNAQSCKVEGIKIAFWGCHGVQGFSNLVIKDCEIDCIGGMIQLGYPSWVCLGNGIEFYLTDNTHDSLVENCKISHCYDAGLTIQGSADKKLSAENIFFKNNIINNCCQSFEEFIRGDTDDSIFVNCVFEYNKSYDAGIDTGFEYDDTRYKRCHILSNSDKRDARMIFRHNLFERGNFRCSGPYMINGVYQYKQGEWEDNICKINLGYDLIGNYSGTNDVIKLPTNKGNSPTLDDAIDKAIYEYRQLTHDYDTTFSILNNS